jgi:hypothetical protein
MTRFKILTLASAVAAAFAVPAALAQQPGANDSSKAVQQRDATGNPSGSPTQPPRSTSSSDRGMNDPTMRSGSASRTDRALGQYDSSTVRNVQQALQNKGYDVGPIDGVMGPKTQSALREFQQQQGLTRSGRIDRQTLSALDVQSTGASGRAGTMGSTGDRSGTMGDRSGTTSGTMSDRSGADTSGTSAAGGSPSSTPPSSTPPSGPSTSGSTTGGRPGG